MSNPPTPLTPQQKIEYLCAKTETLRREIAAVTGYTPSFSIHIVASELADDRDALIAACADLGFDPDPWDHKLVGGAWAFEFDEGQTGLRIVDGNMPHDEPSPVINIDSRDEEVLGRGFIEVLNQAEQ